MWLMMTGRAWGKTLAAVWWIVEEIVKTYDPGQGKCSAPQRIGIVAPTRQSLFDTALHGPTGLLVQAPQESWQWEDRSRVWIRFGCGCRVFGYSAEAPARLRGPGLDKAWADELAAWPNLGAEEKEDAWSLLAPTLRESESPRIVVTTTPKPIKLLTDIIERQGTHLQQGATWDNTALSPEVLDLIRDTYRGRIDEEQELEGSCSQKARLPSGSRLTLTWPSDSEVYPLQIWGALLLPSIHLYRLAGLPPSAVLSYALKSKVLSG